MMTEQQIANVIELIGVIGLYTILFFKILPTYRLDSFRQKMFALRDSMFDFAMEGNISFDDPAYVLLRKQMNGFIRYGHQLTLFRLLMSFAIYKLSTQKEPSGWKESWDSAVQAIENPEVRKRMVKYHNESFNHAVKHVLYGSPFLWCAIFASALTVLFHGAAKGIQQVLTMGAKRVLVGPLDRRLIEEEAAAAA